MLLCLVWEALIWPVASGQVRWHRLLFWERAAPSLCFLCHFQVRPLGHFPLQILPVYFLVGWWKVMTKRLMVVCWLCLRVTMSSQLSDRAWGGQRLPGKRQGRGRAQRLVQGVNVRWPPHWLTGHRGLLGRFVPAADLLSARLWHSCQFAPHACRQSSWQVSSSMASCPPNCTPQSCLCVWVQRGWRPRPVKRPACPSGQAQSSLLSMNARWGPVALSAGCLPSAENDGCNTICILSTLPACFRAHRTCMCNRTHRPAHSACTQ